MVTKYVPGSQPLPIVTSSDNGDTYDRAVAPTDFREALAAQLTETYRGLPTNEIIKELELRRLGKQKSELVDAATANQKYSPQVPYTEPVSKLVAEEIARRDQERNMANDVISRAGSPVALAATGFVGGVIMNALDPINLGSSVALGASGVFSRIANPFMRNVAEGAAGNLLGETVNMGARAENHEQYSAGEFAMNTVGGAIAFAGLAHAGRWAARSGVPRVRELLRRTIGPEAERRLVDLSASRMAAGKNVEVGPVIEHAESEMIPSVRVPEGKTLSVRRESFTKAEDFSNKKMYAATDDGNLSTARTIEHDVIEGTHLTDDPMVAHAHSALDADSVGGRIVEAEMGSANKLLDIDRPATTEVSQAITKALTGVVENPEKFVSGRSVKDVLAEITEAIHSGDMPPEAADAAKQAIVDAGYDGVHYEGGKVGSTQGEPHNIAVLFDHESANKVAEFVPDRTIKIPPDQEAVKAAVETYTRPESDPHYDAKFHKEMLEFATSPPQEKAIAELHADNAAMEEGLLALKEQGYLPADIATDLDKINEAIKRNEVDKVAHKAMMFCLGKNL